LDTLGCWIDVGYNGEVERCFLAFVWGKGSVVSLLSSEESRLCQLFLNYMWRREHSGISVSAKIETYS
jgi:hypothetical protein